MSGRGEQGGEHLAAQRERMIPALLVERDGYARFGRDDRVQQVDEQLELYGYDPAVGFTPTPQPTKADRAREQLEQNAERERQGRVRALLEEREQLEARQLRSVQPPRDRIALVDEQLEHYGYDGGAPE